MKILLITILMSLISCSTNKESKTKSLLLNRDCNPDSARLSGKNYVQDEQKLKNPTFDHCSQAEDNSYKPYESRKKSETLPTMSDALYKCEIDLNGNSYAASNKIQSDAKQRVIKKCLSFEKDESSCTNVQCIQL